MELMVLDGNSIINRAFFGVRLLSTKDGIYTNAIFGFLNILNKLMGEETPDALCVTFDLKAPTFRHEQYEGYKAQRKGMPEELAMQMPILKDVLKAMNIPYYELSGWEADDLIGTISRKCAANGDNCLIVTGDKDSFQLITDTTHVKHVKSRMGQTETKLYTSETFFDEYGFEPIKIIDLKAFMGDTSDNIPGVAGVGEKTAMDLIQRFGTVENIYDNIETLDIRDTVRKKLIAGKDMAKMSYDLATIRCDAPIEFNPSDNLVRQCDNDALYEIFTKLEFSKMIERYKLTPPQSAAELREEYTAEIVSYDITDDNALADMINSLEQCKFASFGADDDFNYITFVDDDKIYNISREGYNGDYHSALRRIFAADIKKSGHDIKRTMRRLIEMDFSTDGWIFDTVIAAYLLDPTANSYDLMSLSEYYCGFRGVKSGDENGQISLLDANPMIEIMQTSEAVWLLTEELTEKCRDRGLLGVLNDIELPLCPVLADMENCGVLVDKTALRDFGDMLEVQIKALEGEIYALADGEFNINSPKQLGIVLFEKLMLPAPKKTKTGYSTNIDVLEKLKNKHPIINMIIDYRQLAKLKSTYADGLIKFIDSDGRIRTTFQNTVTATGRLSSTDPNLQNIPVRTALGEEIRKMFIASDGMVLVDADYSQIELRLLAHISGDETMRDAFLSGEDFHAVTASNVFGVPLGDVTPKMRSSAKAVNFGIVYGISQFSLSQDIGVSVAEAKEYMDRYFERFSGVHRYMEDIVKKAAQDGYVTTIYGRRRDLPELKSSNYNIRSFGERIALNMPIQGTAADIMKIAMIRVYNRLKRENLKSKLLLQIHDELICECPEDEAETVKRILCEEMRASASLAVPLIAEAGSGKSWYEAK